MNTGFVLGNKPLRISEEDLRVARNVLGKKTAAEVKGGNQEKNPNSNTAVKRNHTFTVPKRREILPTPAASVLSQSSSLSVGDVSKRLFHQSQSTQLTPTLAPRILDSATAPTLENHVKGTFGGKSLPMNALKDAEAILDTSGMRDINPISKNPYGVNNHNSINSSNNQKNRIVSDKKTTITGRGKVIPSNPYLQSSKRQAVVNPYAMNSKTPKALSKPQKPATVAVRRRKETGGEMMGGGREPKTDPRPRGGGGTHSPMFGERTNKYLEALTRPQLSERERKFAVRKDEAELMVTMREVDRRGEGNMRELSNVVNSVNLDNACLLRFDTYGVPSFFRSKASTKLALRASIGDEDIYDILCSDRNLKSELLAQKFVTNHYSQIVWKFAGMERRLKETRGTYLTSERVMEGVRNRYKREVLKHQRPAIRKILNKDTTSTRM